MGTEDAAGGSELDRALAVLISSTKRKRRAVALTDIASALQIARKYLGSTAVVARAIGLSGKMLGQFARVEDLTPTARTLVASRTIDSVDAVVQLAQLSPGEQEVIANAIAARELDTKDVRAVVEMRKTSPAKSLLQILDSVKSSKTRRHYVIQFVVRGGITNEDIRQRLLLFLSPANIVEVMAEGTQGRVTLDEKGYSSFKDEAKRRGATIKQLATMITMSV